MKLFTIGDSVSQGFMSFAAANTKNSYSTLIAKQLGLTVGNNYTIPNWNKVGIPFDLENLMRELEVAYGTSFNAIENLLVTKTIHSIVDKSEDFYERGDGKATRPADGSVQYYNNVAVWGFDVADSFQITGRLCKEIIFNKTKKVKDNFFAAGPDNAMYRTALKVLNPALDPNLDDLSQIDWLSVHVTGKDCAGNLVKDSGNKQIGGTGVENLILWLGSNNALGTIKTLEINQTPNKNYEAGRPHEYDHFKRSSFGWNLWHPDDFEADYLQMIGKVDAIMSKNTEQNWKVFVGTVPLVTIAPLAKGIGETTKIPGAGVYYKNYTYFPLEEDYAYEKGWYLTMQDAVHIDNCIRKYNDTIRGIIADLNNTHGRGRYFIVDTSTMLEQLAFKRNAGRPLYKLPKELQYLYPPVNTKYYHANAQGKLKQGGLFSLDGVHPTAIGQGIIAYEFLKVMNQAGVPDANNQPVSPNLKWLGPGGIVTSDTLYMQPLKNMQEVYGKEWVVPIAEQIIHAFRFIEDSR